MNRDKGKYYEEARRPKVTELIDLSLDLRILALKLDLAFLQLMYVNFTFLSAFTRLSLEVGKVPYKFYRPWWMSFLKLA